MPVLSALLTPISLLSLALPSLVISEANSIYPGSASFKLLSSTAFVWRSLTASNYNLTSSSPAFWITASLACGWIGDLCLIPSRKSYFAPAGGHDGDSVWFKLGMLAFMLNHGGYIVAFLKNVELFSGSAAGFSWPIFLGAFTFCVYMGDVLGMPVAWRPNPEAAHPSPRLPTTTIVANTPDSKLDIAAERLLTSLNDVDTLPAAASSKSRPKHTRQDSGVTDLSISIPASKQNSASQSRESTPLLSPTTTSPPTQRAWLPPMLVPSDMKPLIIIYQCIISAMVGAAAATRGLGSARTAGAFMFMISDVIVAMDTFGVQEKTVKKEQKKGRGREGWKLRAFGWGLYFGGQYVLAAFGGQ